MVAFSFNIVVVWENIICMRTNIYGGGGQFSVAEWSAAAQHSDHFNPDTCRVAVCH